MPCCRDHYDNNHAQHVYGAWPLHEINPEDKPDLVLRARRALDLRGDETQAAHGVIHRTLARARLKDGPGVYVNLRKILGNNMVFKSLMTSHNPNLTICNADAANALPAMLTESLLYSRPGILDILPALPDQLPKGTIKGVRGRNRIRVESLAWDTEARTATVVLTSDITQDITLICRRGMTSVTTSATVTSSSLSFTAGTRTTIALGLLTGTFRPVNRRSGTVLDIEDGSTADGAPAGKLLECPGGATTQGQALDQSTDITGAHQWWKPVPTTSGYPAHPVAAQHRQQPGVADRPRVSGCCHTDREGRRAAPDDSCEPA